MPANASRASRAATCEEWDEDAQTTLPDTRTSANVAAKRSKPELNIAKSHRRRSTEANADKMRRTPTNTQDDASSRKEKKIAGLKLATTFPERDSRLYSSGPPAERPRRSTSRPAAKRTISKAEQREPFTRHQIGECWICDMYGYHVVMPREPQPPSKETSVPQSPLTASQQPSYQASVKAERPEATTIQTRPNRSQSYRDLRPISFHAGMIPEAFHPLVSQPLSAYDWNMPTTPITPYTATAYPPTPTLTSHNQYQDYLQPSLLQYSQSAPPLPIPPPPQPGRGISVRGQPIIQQSSIPMDQPPLSRTTSLREQQRSRKNSLSREENAKKMPPPQGIPASRRPNMLKANTSTSTPVSLHRARSHSNHASVPAQSIHKERRPDPPPSSYRERPLAVSDNSSQQRPVPRQSKTYADRRHSLQVSSSVPGPDKGSLPPNVERHESEAEAYQRSRGTKPQALTLDTVSRISRHSDSGSQRSANTSSKGSLGGKTKTTAANTDITMTINGVILGISGDNAENHSIKIHPKRNGGVNISVNERESGGSSTKVTSMQKRSGSISSSSRQSRRNSEKEVRKPRVESLDRKLDGASKPSSRSDRTSYDDSLGYGFAYG